VLKLPIKKEGKTMLGSRRNPRSQSKHDRRVLLEARKYERSGYDVEAHVDGYLRPGEVYGYIPDVKAEKDSYVCIVEVETLDSINSAHALAQHHAFLKARRYRGWHYRRVIAR
jgi:hypothetical protein